MGQARQTIDLTVEFTFAAAHRLPRYQGPCFDLHGHNYTLLVTVRGVPHADTGLVQDFDELDRVIGESVIAACDHKYLNDFIENPTAEEILRWMWARLEGKIPDLYELKLYEMPRYSATLTRA